MGMKCSTFQTGANVWFWNLRSGVVLVAVWSNGVGYASSFL